MANQIKITMHVEFSWWLKIYLWLLILFCRAFNLKPDDDKLAAIIEKGCRITVCQSKQS